MAISSTPDLLRTVRGRVSSLGLGREKRENTAAIIALARRVSVSETGYKCKKLDWETKDSIYPPMVLAWKHGEYVIVALTTRCRTKGEAFPDLVNVNVRGKMLRDYAVYLIGEGDEWEMRSVIWGLSGKWPKMGKYSHVEFIVAHKEVWRKAFVKLRYQGAIDKSVGKV